MHGCARARTSIPPIELIWPAWRATQGQIATRQEPASPAQGTNAATTRSCCSSIVMKTALQHPQTSTVTSRQRRKCLGSKLHRATSSFSVTSRREDRTRNSWRRVTTDRASVFSRSYRGDQSVSDHVSGSRTFEHPSLHSASATASTTTTAPQITQYKVLLSSSISRLVPDCLKIALYKPHLRSRTQSHSLIFHEEATTRSLHPPGS